jgi:hypothetical protein
MSSRLAEGLIVLATNSARLRGAFVPIVAGR